MSPGDASPPLRIHEADPKTAPIVDAWCEVDHTRAFLAADHDVILATRPLRAFVVEALLREPCASERDFLHAVGALGRILADLGGSPTLAASSIDGLVAAMGEGRSAAFAIPARAAMVESYVHAMAAALRKEACKGWEYPRCVVALHEGVAAIAAGHPTDDNEALTYWASRVAQGVALSGVRRAVVSGSEKAALAIEEALEVAGVERLDRYAGGAGNGRAKAPR